MTELEMQYFKEQVSKFYILFEGLATYFDMPIVTTISVLLQNLAFNGKGSKGYSHEEEVTRVNTIVSLLEKIKDYNDYYLTRLAYEEMSDILFVISSVENIEEIVSHG